MVRKLFIAAPFIAVSLAAVAAQDGGQVQAWPQGSRTVDPQVLPMPAESFGQVNETLGNPHDPDVLSQDDTQGDPTSSDRSPFPPFAELDENGDGVLDPQEVAGLEDLQRQFEAADINQDGSLDESEFSAFEVTEGVMPGLENPPTGDQPVGSGESQE